MPNVFGPMMLKSNGHSYMGFDLSVEALSIIGNTISSRYDKIDGKNISSTYLLQK